MLDNSLFAVTEAGTNYLDSLPDSLEQKFQDEYDLLNLISDFPQGTTLSNLAEYMINYVRTNYPKTYDSRGVTVLWGPLRESVRRLYERGFLEVV